MMRKTAMFATLSLLMAPAIAVVSQTAPVPAKAEAPLAACPGLIRYVQVEADAGKYNPPAYLVPAWDNGKQDKELYAEWNDVENQNVVLHCHMEPPPGSPPQALPKVVKVTVPAQANKCVRFRNEFTCFVAPPMSNRANPSPAK